MVWNSYKALIIDVRRGREQNRNYQQPTALISYLASKRHKSNKTQNMCQLETGLRYPDWCNHAASKEKGYHVLKYLNAKRCRNWACFSGKKTTKNERPLPKFHPKKSIPPSKVNSSNIIFENCIVLF
jgi:hypothetical protein